MYNNWFCFILLDRKPARFDFNSIVMFCPFLIKLYYGYCSYNRDNIKNDKQIGDYYTTYIRQYYQQYVNRTYLIYNKNLFYVLSGLILLNKHLRVFT